MKLLYKIFNRITKKKNIIFTVPVEKQRQIIEKLGDAKDNYDRAFKQYYCQMKLYGSFYSFMYNILSVFPLIYYLIKLKTIDFVWGDSSIRKSKVAVFFLEGKDKGIVQDSLIQEFEKAIFIDSLSSNYIDKEAKQIWKKLLKKYGFRPYFLLKVLVKLSIYSNLINENCSKALVVCSEFSFASPITTEYCRQVGVELINIMHGEKLFCIRDSYTCFDRFFVWDKSYADLFIRLKADQNQFVIERPRMFCVDKNKYEGHKHFCTYYLADENQKELERIKLILETIKEYHSDVAVRIHPRAVDRASVEKMLSSFNIENNTEVSIDESICSTGYAISLYSTVLNQSYYNDIKVIIDDISKPEKYNELKSLEYILLDKDIILLSDFLDKEGLVVNFNEQTREQ